MGTERVTAIRTMPVKKFGVATHTFIYAVCTTALILSGCATWRLGTTLPQYQGLVLPVKNGGPGTARLRLEGDFDSTVRDYVQQNGQPDYIHEIDAYALQLIYLDRQRVVVFRRPWWAFASRASVTEGIPEGLAKLLIKPDLGPEKLRGSVQGESEATERVAASWRAFENPQAPVGPGVLQGPPPADQQRLTGAPPAQNTQASGQPESASWAEYAAPLLAGAVAALSTPSAGGAASIVSNALQAASGQGTGKVLIFGGPEHDVYLGCLSCGLASDSVTNESGLYGSQLSPTSIWNSLGQYGSPVSAYSACNQLASDPPVIVDAQGNYYGRLTVNQLHPQVARDAELIDWLERVVCEGGDIEGDGTDE